MKKTVYKIENIINGYMYIGQTKDIIKRFKSHKNKLKRGEHNKLFQKDWDKYGEKNFIFKTLNNCDDDEEAAYLESYYILKYYPKIYNLTKGKKLKEVWLEQAKQKLRIPKSLETKQKMSDNHADFSGENNPFHGQHHTQETIEKLIEINKGKSLMEETKQKQSDANKNRIFTNDTKCKMSESAINRREQLTIAEVKYIKIELNNKIPVVDIANKLKIPRDTIYAIKSGRNWKSVIV